MAAPQANLFVISHFCEILRGIEEQNKKRESKKWELLHLLKIALNTLPLLLLSYEIFFRVTRR